MKPKVSIITVVFNGENIIEKTMQSVFAQTYDNIEYIIVDGKSSDNTLSIIEKYKEKISVLISEKDKGLYDAMNKGLQVATGDYVWFMNGGDQIADAQVLTKIFCRINGIMLLFLLIKIKKLLYMLMENLKARHLLRD